MEEKIPEIEKVADLYEHYQITVDPKQVPIRIDKYLLERVEKMARSKIQAGCKEGYITVNGQTIKPNYKVRPGDEISVSMTKPKGPGVRLLGEDIPIDVVYEDDHLLVLNKQAGLVVHPGFGNSDGTLVNALIHYLDSSDLPVMDGNPAERPGIVHRIDKDTSGLMVVAKTEEAITGLGKQFYDHSIERTYQALVWGDVLEQSGTIEGHIGRHAKDRLQMAVQTDGTGKHAITHYEVLESLYYVTLVKCVLETGRTHQIRVHMKHIGHTLFNDARYGGDRVLKGTVFSKYKQFVDNTFKLLPRQALHASTLGFVHPVSGERMDFSSPLPEDFAAALEKWRGYTKTRKDQKEGT